MVLKITPTMLGTLVNGKFTPEACEAICRWYEDFQDYKHVPYIGDVMVSFAEIASEDVEEHEVVLEKLSNGNTVIFM